MFDGTTQRVFLDGVAVHSAAAPRPGPLRDERKLNIGYGWSDPAAGVLGAIRISSTARYREAFTPELFLSADRSTVLLYDMSVQQGSTLEDGSGHGRHGTFEACTWVRPPGEGAPP